MFRPAGDDRRQIPGTYVFDGDAAQRGFAINDMCFSFNKAENREAFAADEEAYMDRYGLSEEQKKVIRDRDVIGMLNSGGNIYYLAKLAGILGLGVQDIGALQTGTTVDEFKAALLAHGTRLKEMTHQGEAA
ncbi:protocatechuate 4,5-dioxygenase subunit alpha [Altericroceibacterium spongiae]|uniref:Protocatechuate 4,5-dioxygenase subunit alpha n=1 Tax=Altericroceibacterium spongiae TaxID=2320269 RepID=A0A420EMS6_9SPHN|nr:protocatechuate 4,5-dioxygenase subunit alpha [Altericroceibacterium spongiae]RKF22019.1 protocatechuate 4,5-dioxygenase subunit alpha [Altericroceibacterium spongiae]